MTDCQLNQIRYEIMLWCSLVVANLATNVWIVGWFLFVAAWSFYRKFTDVDMKGRIGGKLY